MNAEDNDRFQSKHHGPSRRGMDFSALHRREKQPGTTVDVGASAPPIRLPAHDGRLWRLADHRGHPVVLIFHRHLH